MKKKKFESGQGLLEFSISFIIFVILLVGIVDLGRLFFTYMALRDAAQEGAAYGSVNPMKVSDIQNRVRGVSTLPLDFSDENLVGVYITVDYNSGPCAGQDILVRVETDYRIIMPLIGTIIGSETIKLVAEATDQILRPPCNQ
jgi:hypothetical protein